MRALLAELRTAEGQLPYVSRGYFVNRWCGVGSIAEPAARDGLLDRLVAGGIVERYELTDAKGRPPKAIRTGGDESEPEAAESATASR